MEQNNDSNDILNGVVFCYYKKHYLCTQETTRNLINRNKMSLIINYRRLEVESALADPKHPMYPYAKEYDDGLKELHRKYPDGILRFMRVGYPKYSDSYLSSRGVETAGVPEPTPPMTLSLRANVSHPKRGNEQWAVCLGVPYALPGDLWDIGGKLDTKTIQIFGEYTVNLTTNPDLAFFLAFKSPHVKGGHLKVDDPKAELKLRAEREVEMLDVNVAIWKTLQDEDLLKKMASSFGLEIKGKDPNQLRFELKDVLIRNDKAQKSDPSIRGTKELMDDLKITDYMRLTSFVRYWLDESKITYKPDGRYRVGDKIIAHVPAEQVKKKFDWLCNYFSAPNNGDKLKELMMDLVNKEYLDAVTDEKDFRWLAKAMEISGYYNQPIDKVKGMVYEAFNVS